MEDHLIFPIFIAFISFIILLLLHISIENLKPHNIMLNHTHNLLFYEVYYDFCCIGGDAHMV